MDLLDPLSQPRVLKRPVRRGATLPVVKPSPAHTQHAAHHGDGIVALLRGDQRVRLVYRPSSSLAKKTAAFRRISRSIRSFAFSSRNRPSFFPLIATQTTRPPTPGGLSSDEREELQRLWDENAKLRMEREILRKAAVFFAKEDDGR